jgi:very-short-patch-repair endonuclease
MLMGNKLSYLEQHFAKVVVEAKLPTPVREYQFFRYRFDFAWPKIKVAVEVDGEHHKKGDQLRSDKRKDRVAKIHGWVVIRADRNSIHSPEFLNKVRKTIRERINQIKKGFIS